MLSSRPGHAVIRTMKPCTFLQAAGVPAGPAPISPGCTTTRNSVQEAISRSLQTSAGETHQLPGLPWRFAWSGAATHHRCSGSGSRITPMCTPRLLGLSEAEIARLIEEQVIYFVQRTSITPVASIPCHRLRRVHLERGASCCSHEAYQASRNTRRMGSASAMGFGFVARARSCRVAAAMASRPSCGTSTSRRREGRPSC